MNSPLPIIHPVATDTYVTQELAKIGAKKKQSLYARMPQEERDEVLEKVSQLVKQPAGQLAKEDELYLEQQMTDLLGFEVAAELDGHHLEHQRGVMAAQMHLRRFPTDSLDQHDVYREAGLSPNRSLFGWFTELGQLTPEAIVHEKYFFTVQADFLPDWHAAYEDLTAWFKFRKMIVINGAEKRAVVGVVGNTGPPDWMQKQFGGSPEVIREGLIWSPKTRGRVFMLFVNDPENKVPLGPMNLGGPSV